MQMCIDLAKQGFGLVSPNPMVGSVIVYNEEIIGKGYHEKYGAQHAEVNAIDSVKNKSLLKESTLYVNLEPCSHFGKTPPCSDMIIEYKIQKVVIGCIDTFSAVSGKGIKRLEDAGVEVKVGVLEKESRELNKRFFTYYERKRPYIILKWAKSKDGFIAPARQKKPFWMTSKESKKLVHQWRSEEDSVLVGRVTAEQDNPSLTVREIAGRNPLRIVIDQYLKLPKNLNLFNNKARTIIFNKDKTYKETLNSYIKLDFNNIIINILEELYKQKVQSIIIEGGLKTLQSFIEINMWDEARVFSTAIDLNDGIKSPLISKKHSYTTLIKSDELRYFFND